MPLEQGSLIYTNYTARVKDTGEVIETTIEEEAKKRGMADSDRKYLPRLVAVGERWVLAGLDDEIKKMNVGQKKEIELTPAKAFGERDPTKVRMIPVRKFGEKASELTVGDTVEVDNRLGMIRYIGSGRAQVDFNHRLAGKTLVYDLEVVRKLETNDEKIRALVERRFVGEGEKVNFDLKEGALVVEIPEDLFLFEGLQIIKRGISNDVFRFVGSVEDVTFRETFRAKKPETKVQEQTATVMG